MPRPAALPKRESAGGAAARQAAHRLCLLRSARACGRLRHDRRAGDARPSALRDFRLLLRHRAHGPDAGADQELRRQLARHQRKLSDEQAAAKIAEDGIDILVDLNGYTKDARTKIFALRPAPVIVNWFGFPGTMGTPYHHYLIADPFVVPEEQRDLLLRAGRAAAVLSAQRPQAAGLSPRPGAQGRAPARGRVRLLLPQRHAEDHARRLPELAAHPERGAETACCGCSPARARRTRGCGSWPSRRA